MDTISRFKNMTATAMAALVIFLQPADSQPNLIVVELYTSQGCSSCPPADRILSDELAEIEGVLPFSMHVDYWDHLGWTDIFSHRIFTNRQRAYAQAANLSMIYTPQMIVQGESLLVGSDAESILAAVEYYQQKMDQQQHIVEPVLDDGILVIAPLPEDFGTDFFVQLVRFVNEPQEVMINRGENAGNANSYLNVVNGLQSFVWSGRGEFTARSFDSIGDNEEVAVILQKRLGFGLPGPILGAARFGR